MKPTFRACVNATTADHGNAIPLMHELRHALERLLVNGEESTIDLNRLPLGSTDEESLEKLLGKGEIEATLHALGASSIEETAFPGVWRITHYDDRQRVVARFLSVCWVPDILRAHRTDVEDGACRLAELAGESASPVNSEVNS